MKFKEYVKTINEFAAKHPEALEFDVVSSKDDEGNGYNPIYYSPSLLAMDEGCELICSADDEEVLKEEGVELNCVCIN